MPTQTAEAVVLRQYALGEADRIIVLFTREFGKLRAVARGARKLRNRFGGSLEPFTHIRLHFFLKEGAELARIDHCEVVHAYMGQGMDLDRLYAFTYFAEIIQQIVEDNNANQYLFRLFISALQVAEETRVSVALVHYFEVWALKLSGWFPNYGTCSKCGKCVKDCGFYALLEVGQGLCAQCANERGLHVRPAAARAIFDMSTLSPREFTVRSLDATASSDLERLIQKHFEWQLERQLKSYPALREMLNG
jgi:DNA repair protein RecO (recombination protein O)